MPLEVLRGSDQKEIEEHAKAMKDYQLGVISEVSKEAQVAASRGLDLGLVSCYQPSNRAENNV